MSGSLLSSSPCLCSANECLLLTHWAERSTSWRGLGYFRFHQPFNLRVSLSECVRVWSGNLPEVIFSLLGQGTSRSMETCSGPEARPHVLPSAGGHGLRETCLGPGWPWLGSRCGTGVLLGSALAVGKRPEGIPGPLFWLVLLGLSVMVVGC